MREKGEAGVRRGTGCGLVPVLPGLQAEGRGMIFCHCLTERELCVCVCFLTPAGCVSLHHRCEAAPLPAALVSSLLPFDQHTHTHIYSSV